jgi:hypothetical protein
MSPPSITAQTFGLAVNGRRRHRFPPLCGGNLRPRGQILAAGADLHFVCPPWRPGIWPRRRFWGHFNGPKRLNPPPYWRSNFVCRQYLADLTAAARPSVPYGHTIRRPGRASLCEAPPCGRISGGGANYWPPDGTNTLYLAVVAARKLAPGPSIHASHECEFRRLCWAALGGPNWAAELSAQSEPPWR